MTPAETITAAVAFMAKYRDETYIADFRDSEIECDMLEKLEASLLRLLPLAELSPEVLRYVAIELDKSVSCMTPLREGNVAKLRRAADALEGRQG